ELSDQSLYDVCDEIRLGAMRSGAFDDVEALVLSPGVDPGQPVVHAVKDRSIPIFGELELVGNLDGRVAAITGTNGKSTVTSLLGRLIRSVGKTAFVGGNLGEPIATHILSGEKRDSMVLELSSYQLETAYRFRPDVAIVLNISPDHLSRYHDLASYARTKRRIIENMGPEDVAILNFDDPHVAAMSTATKAKILWFSTRGTPLPGPGASLIDGKFIPHKLSEFLTESSSGFLEESWGDIDLEESKLLGLHNRENAVAALLGAIAMGCGKTKDEIQTLCETCLDFPGLEHRLERVAEVNDILYINDSKATNDDAAKVALEAMTRPAVLLVGGMDKGTGYSAVTKASLKYARVVIAFGEARHVIESALTKHPRVFVRSTMEEAFDLAVEEARGGDVVLLAPACSSFDQYQNFKVRGDVFRSLVAELSTTTDKS
ncbi:UDP-N-acetylmuramoyl-L-alanine--D-glutamate ligase, partial [Myxococcota bacterium]|nr:UDP-N-acetylmuramoyl-L-alanine--D-glutamate ligase [Myxococcota bacterium]